MCNSTAVMGAQAGGLAYSTVGAYYASQAQKSALNGQARLADINAQLSELSAQTALNAGQRQEQSARLKNASVKGSQRASLAANGVALDSDTAVNIVTTTDVIGEIEANDIAANAISTAWGYRAQATNYRNDATLKRGQAKGINSGMAAASTFLTGATQIASSHYLAKKYGVE